MKPFSATTRNAVLERLGQEAVDVLVIGGGITGAGVALDAAARGYSVALVEKSDFASGTSSKSTKLVHGGIRYLPQYDFALVREALVERGLLIKNAPFLVQPLGFVLPLYEDAKRPVGVPFTPPGGRGLGLMLTAGLTLYDVLAGGKAVSRHTRIPVTEAERLTPKLKSAGMKEAFLYWDAQTNDTRLTLTVLRTAADHGAMVANYTEVVGFERTGTKLSGARIRDVLTGQERTVHARHIVNAAGIFAENVTALTGDESDVAIAPSKGVHLVVERSRVGLDEMGVVLPETEDGRLLFVIPWGARAVIGTTDTGTGELDDPVASPADIDYLLRHVNRYMDVNLTRDDILSVYAGYRPLVRSKKKATANLSRTHVVLQEPNGMVVIVGGKLTTYRRMAQDTVDVLAKRDAMPIAHPTQSLPLSGAIGWNVARSGLETELRQRGLGEDTVQHLLWNYGRNAEVVLDLVNESPELGERILPDLPYLRAELVFACRYEMALTLDDVLARRTRIELEDAQRGAGVAQEVAERLATELGWSPEHVASEVQEYARYEQHHIEAEGLEAGVSVEQSTLRQPS